MQILDFLCTRLLGSCLPPFLLAAGLFFAIRLSFFPLRHPIRTVKAMGEGGKLRSSLSALGVALAGTLGVGNIAGVGVALTVGGAGSVFWMILGGTVMAFLKYAEITLALASRGEGAEGDALSYIRPTLGRTCALLFSLFTLSLSLSMGSLLQGRVITDALCDAVPLYPPAVGLLLSGITLLLFLGGYRAVARLSGILIPLVTLLYTLAALCVLIVHAEALPSVLLRILGDAFSLRSAGGGLMGLGITRAMRAGLMRSLFSNEAGAGTAPFAHAHATAPPVQQGLFGIVEVLLDTVGMCTLTALAVLSSFDTLPSLSGAALVAAAFGTVFGRGAEILVLLAIVLFAYATVACWVEYGRCALGKLSSRRFGIFIYAIAFSLSLTLGSLISTEGAWSLCDLILGLMSLINTTALLKNHKKIRTLTEEYGLMKP